ncbi:MAG: nickel pincer cofactor biosynthesis protein LarB [Salinirussus sp.]
MRDILEAVAGGDLSPAAAEARLRGYATGDAGRFDAARVERSGVPEAILAEGKTLEQVEELTATSLETTNRAIVTRLDDTAPAPLREAIGASHPDASVRLYPQAGMLVATTSDFERPQLQATVGVVAAGSADANAAEEAAVTAGEIGAAVRRVDDVGVASIARLTDQLDELRDLDVLVVAAGREGALPTVVAGLVDVPVIGLPVGTGYGHGGGGEAALAGMLQSCTALTVVNIDAGFTAGAQAGLIARRLDAARE